MNLFVDVIRALPAGWHTNIPAKVDVKAQKTDEERIADIAKCVLYNMALFVRCTGGYDNAKENEDRFAETVLLATMPNRRRQDLRHLAALRENAKTAMTSYLSYAKKIGVDVTKSERTSVELAAAETWPQITA